MATARLSPAANLLRNSKLFALPPTIALPTPEPSSEPVPRSDSATTIYPTRAAIETAGSSLFRGDWGLKRPLPLKSTVKSRVVRLNNGIDTREHIADFDSAADHVLTLKKFQQLNQAIKYPGDRVDNVHAGVFDPDQDNITDAPSSSSHRPHTGVWPDIQPSTVQKQLPDSIARRQQALQTQQAVNEVSKSESTKKPRRWRFNGPSLVQMSGFEFDRYVKSLDSEKRKAFRNLVKQKLLSEGTAKATSTARDQGTMGESNAAAVTVTEEQITNEIRKLRQNSEQFGPLIAQLLDLPDGPAGTSISTAIAVPKWNYRSGMFPSEYYQEAGPPRTHPSAGLSYIHSQKFVENDALFGPQHDQTPVVARVLKTRAQGPRNVGNIGLAGFVIAPQGSKRGDSVDIPAFEPTEGGQKLTRSITGVEITEQGAVRINTKNIAGYVIQDDGVIPYEPKEKDEPVTQQPPQQSGDRVKPSLARNKLNYRKRQDLDPDQDVDDALANAFKKSEQSM